MTSRDTPHRAVDMETLRRIDGLYAGQLDDYETQVLHDAIEQRLAYKDFGYSAAGFMLCLSKVKVI